MKLSLGPLLVLVLGSVVVACGSRFDGGASAPGSPSPAARANEAHPTAAEIPQSITPEARPRQRTAAVLQRWSARVGRTDHRTTMALVDGRVIIGGRGPSGGAGVHVLDAKTGRARAALPAARGDVVGIAVDKDRVFSTSSGGEIAAATLDGRLLFRAEIGAAATTPPSIFTVDGALAVAVGDASGKVSVVDAASGKKRWSTIVGPAKEAHAIGSALAVADLDGDGIPEIIAGSENGTLVALHASKGDVAWTTSRSSALRAAPVLGDLDADGKLETIAAWADGDVAIFDRDGKEKWSAHVEHDNGDPTGLLASPMPVPGPRIGSLLVPCARWGADDAVVLLRRHYRAYQSQQGRITSSAVLGVLEPGTATVEAVLGTTKGDVVSFDSVGEISFLYHVDGSIEAAPMLADVDGDGVTELLVVTTAGDLYALATQSVRPPVLARARGDLHNSGVLPPTDLAWGLPPAP